MLLDVPANDVVHLGTVARDHQLYKDKANTLVVRSTFPSLQEIQAIADDAIFASTGSDKDSVAAESKDCGVVFRPAQKMQHRLAEGLSIVRSAMAATGRAPDSPWLMWSQHCEAWEATVPGLIKRPRDPTSAPTGNRITSLMQCEWRCCGGGLKRSHCSASEPL